jgi:hypothetical protein
MITQLLERKLDSHSEKFLNLISINSFGFIDILMELSQAMTQSDLREHLQFSHGLDSSYICGSQQVE